MRVCVRVFYGVRVGDRAIAAVVFDIDGIINVIVDVGVSVTYDGVYGVVVVAAVY